LRLRLRRVLRVASDSVRALSNPPPGDLPPGRYMLTPSPGLLESWDSAAATAQGRFQMLTFADSITHNGVEVSSLLGEFLNLTIGTGETATRAVVVGSRTDLLRAKAVTESGAARFMVQLTDKFIGGSRVRVARVDAIGLDVCAVYLG